MGFEQPPTITPLEDIKTTHKQLVALFENKPDNSVLNKDDIANIKFELEKLVGISKRDDSLSDLAHNYDSVASVLDTLSAGDIKRMLNKIADKNNFE